VGKGTDGKDQNPLSKIKRNTFRCSQRRGGGVLPLEKRVEKKKEPSSFLKNPGKNLGYFLIYSWETMKVET